MSIEALSMVLNHSQARGAAKIVLLGIANHLGPDADEGAWPSQDRLASYANISDRAVRKAVRTLVELGELRVEVADGVSRNQYKPNRYWIRLHCPADCDGSMWHRRVELSDTQGGTFEQSGRNFLTDRVEPEFLLISKETVENRHINMFDEFWSVYPRRENKGRARTAFNSAVRKADPRTIIEGAKRYRDDPTRSDQFTAHPSSWLNGERWLDEVTKPKQSGPVTVMDMYADEPCTHGDPLGEARCPLCRRK
jgi:hypothetical protein